MTPRTGFPFLDDGGPVLAFAHRGGARHPDLLGRENTLAAFRHAVALGYRYLETDVHLTRDGVLVAFHDALLDRVTDGVGSIADLDTRRPGPGPRRRARQVPTLAELVDAFPEARFNLDLKADAAVEPLAAFVAERGLQDRVLVGSFSWRRLHRFRGLAGPRVPTSAAPLEVAAYVVLPGRLARRAGAAGGRAAGPPPRPAACPSPPPRWYAAPTPSASTCTSGPSTTPTRCALLLDLGVDGLMTDRTDVLAAVLRERGLWPGTTGVMTQDVADLEPLERAREQRAWNWYDWANSAYYTTILTVLFAPYLITVAGRAAGCGDSADESCHRTVDVLGLPLAAGSLPFYLTSFATIASAFLLPVVGALVDRSGHKKWHMAGFAWAGSFFAALLFFMHGDHWQLGGGRDRAQQHPGRLLAGQLLRDPRRHLHRGRARPGVVARLGVRLPRRRPAARWSTW